MLGIMHACGLTLQEPSLGTAASYGQGAWCCMVLGTAAACSQGYTMVAWFFGEPRRKQHHRVHGIPGRQTQPLRVYATFSSVVSLTLTQALTRANQLHACAFHLRLTVGLAVSCVCWTTSRHGLGICGRLPLVSEGFQLGRWVDALSCQHKHVCVSTGRACGR